MKGKTRFLPGRFKVYHGGMEFRRLVIYDERTEKFAVVIKGSKFEVRPARGRTNAFEVVRSIEQFKARLANANGAISPATELRTVFSQDRIRPAALFDDLFEHTTHSHSSNRSVYFDRQALPAVGVEHREQSDAPAVAHGSWLSYRKAIKVSKGTGVRTKGTNPR